MASRVLMVGPSPEAWGGVATVEKNILDAVASTGREVRFVATMRDGCKLTKALMFPEALVEVHRELRHCDVCHIHTALGMSYKRKYLICREAVKASVPYVLHVHEADFESQYECMAVSEQAKVRWMMQNASRVIALSEEWRRYFVNKFELDNIVVLENAVFVPQKISEHKNPTRFFFLGRMCSRKGVDTLLRAVQSLISIHPEAKVLLAGGGEELESYRKLASELGVEGNVEFLGWADESVKQQLVDECLTSVLPSKAEGLPMCVLESMAAGCVAIATRVGGLPSLIEGGANGLLVEPCDPDGLSRAMAYCIENPAEALKIASRARQTIIECYSMETYLSKLELIYEEAASNC